MYVLHSTCFVCWYELKILWLQDETLEETGWKLVHGDVFRPPQRPKLLSAFIGSGIQIFCVCFIVIGEPTFSDDLFLPKSSCPLNYISPHHLRYFCKLTTCSSHLRSWCLNQLDLPHLTTSATLCIPRILFISSLLFLSLKDTPHIQLSIHLCSLQTIQFFSLQSWFHMLTHSGYKLCNLPLIW